MKSTLPTSTCSTSMPRRSVRSAFISLCLSGVMRSMRSYCTSLNAACFSRHSQTQMMKKMSVLVSSSSTRDTLLAMALITDRAMMMNMYVISLTGIASVRYLIIENMPKSPMPIPMLVFVLRSSSSKIMK